MIGEIINYRYEIQEKIGTGAVFTVYKCKDKVLNRLIALKVLNTEFRENREFIARIAENAGRANKLDHPAIAKVQECDTSGSIPIIACEFSRGISLRERLHRDGPMSAEAATEAMKKILDALEYAHASGVVHGNLRPEDVIVSPDGEVRITDFGMAAALRACPDVGEKLAMRSIRYQSPELTEGASFSPSNDIYSAGAIFYEMLTGRPPYDGANPLAIAVKKIKEPPPNIRQIRPEVPKSLNDFALRALQVDPAMRFVSITSMKKELNTISASASQPGTGVHTRHTASPQPELKSSYWKEVGILSLVFVAVVLIVMSAVLYFNKSGKKIVVPALMGLSWEEASEAAQKAGVVLVDAGRGYSDSFRAGLICEQIPAPGDQVQSDKPEVRVKISDGPSWSTVPNLLNMPEANARELAIRSSFNIGKITEEYSATVPPNSVIRQDPEAGVQRSPNSDIDIIISKGVKPPTQESPNDSGGREEPSKEQTFTVEVTVPANIDAPGNIKIVVKDDTGENTVVDEDQPPGTYDYEITTLGNRPQIQILLDGEIIKTERP